MSYTKRSISKDEERSIVTAMITSSDFLKRIRPLYKPNFFTLGFARTVASWIVEYFDAYEKAPARDIQSIFEGKKSQIIDEEQIETISTFLESLSDSFDEEKFNLEYEIDKAVKYFKGISIDNFIDNLKAHRLVDDYESAEAAIAGYTRIEKNKGGAIDFLNDVDAAVRAIRSNTDDALFSLPGQLGKFVSPIKRDDFFVVVAPAKRGKTYWLMELAMLAFFNQVNVLFYSFEMTEKQILVRMYQRILGGLEPSDDEHDNGREIEIPFFDQNYENNKIVNYRREIKHGITSIKTLKKLGLLRSLVKNKRFQLKCHPAGSMSVNDISTDIDNLEHYDNFVPDLVVADYLDIFKPEKGGERRHQIDDTWRAFRALGQSRSIGVISASHSAKATFDRDIRQNDFSEDSRKLNHVTTAIALNQTDEESEQGVMRISRLADRFKRPNKSMEAVVLQCFDIGKAYLDSRIVKKEE